jgi:hypothetical protein
MVWVTPVIESFVSRAAAASLATCGCADCSVSAEGCGTVSGGTFTTCPDGTPGFCDQTAEGLCVCDVTNPISFTFTCTSSSQCVQQFGAGYHCIGGFGPANVCIQQCCGPAVPLS